MASQSQIDGKACFKGFEQLIVAGEKMTTAIAGFEGTEACARHPTMGRAWLAFPAESALSQCGGP
jgi:hypothetical protein